MTFNPLCPPDAVTLATWGSPGGDVPWYFAVRPVTRSGVLTIATHLRPPDEKPSERASAERWNMVTAGHERPIALFEMSPSNQPPILITLAVYHPIWDTRSFTLRTPRISWGERRIIADPQLSIIVSMWKYLLNQPLEPAFSLYADIPTLMIHSPAGAKDTVAHTQRLLDKAPLIELTYDPTAYRLLGLSEPWLWAHSGFLAWIRGMDA